MDNLRKRLGRFFTCDLWQLRLSDQPAWRRPLLRQLRLWILVGREFVADRCLLQASALAFATLLSLVPLLALMFAVLKGFGVQNRLQPLLLEYLSVGSDAVPTAIITYINNTSMGKLGMIGLVALILSVLSLISGVEKSFNTIWGVEETRSISRRFTSYFSIVTIGPLFVVAAISMTGSLESQILVQWLLDKALVGNLLIILFNVLPFVVMWLVFAGLYLFIPNTRVAPHAAMVGGIFGGTLWQLSQWAYVDFQVGVARYNAIYGTLAALPIFMVWLYLAWAIVLLGLEVTFAVQNLRNVSRDLRGGRISIAGRTRIILSILVHLALVFRRGEPPPPAEAIAEELEIPPRLLRTILDLLQRLGVVAEVVGTDGENGYLPAREPAKLLLTELLGGIADDGSDYRPPEKCAAHGSVTSLVAQLTNASDGALQDVTLADLVEQAEKAGKGGCQSAGAG
jgi:membrane protein